MFVDGSLTTQLPVEGRKASPQATVALGPEARWVTLVSVDTTGHESVAKGQALPGAGAPTVSRLLAVAIGTDPYDDKDNLEQLLTRKQTQAISQRPSKAFNVRFMRTSTLPHSSTHKPSNRTSGQAS